MRRDMTLSEYLTWWRRRPAGDGSSGSGSTLKHPQNHAAAASGADASGCTEGGNIVPAPSSMAGGSSNGSQQSQPLLYLKDWHFASEHPHYQVTHQDSIVSLCPP